jgi:hypothetical protein
LFTINHSILNSKFIISHLKSHFMMDFSCLYQYVNERFSRRSLLAKAD